MKFMSTFLTVFSRNFVTTWLVPISLLISLIYPIIWLVIFGQLFSGVQVPGNSANYITYLTPGIFVSTAVFGSLWSGLGLLMDEQSGVLQRMISTSRSKCAIVVAYVFQSITVLLAQGVIVLLIATKMGAVFIWGINLLFAFLILILLAVFLSSISHILVITLKRQDSVVGAINISTLPILFLSNVLFPSEGGFGKIVMFNPIDHAVSLIRPLMLEGGFPANGMAKFQIGSLIILSLLGLVATILSVRMRRFQ